MCLGVPSFARERNWHQPDYRSLKFLILWYSSMVVCLMREFEGFETVVFVSMVTPEELDFLFAEYTVGALTMPAAVLVRSHLELNPQSRRWAGDLAALGGLLLDDAGASTEDTAPVTADEVLMWMDEQDQSEPVCSRKMCNLYGKGNLLPETLHRFLGHKADAIDWQFRLPGIREFPIRSDDGGTASLVKIAAGRTIPSHTHEGREITLVLQGGISDQTGHYVRGDIAIADERIDHRPVADKDEDCILFSVRDAEIKLTGPIGRMISRIAL